MYSKLDAGQNYWKAGHRWPVDQSMEDGGHRTESVLSTWLYWSFGMLTIASTFKDIPFYSKFCLGKFKVNLHSGGELPTFLNRGFVSIVGV